MSRIFARDVVSAIDTLLTNGFASALSTIDTERTDSTPAVVSITSGWQNGQFPMIFIDVEDSTIQHEELRATYTDQTEVFTVNIMATIKSADPRISQWIENYIEAMIRVLQNYSDNGISWIDATATMREQVQSVDNSFMKTGGVRFEVRTN